MYLLGELRLDVVSAQPDVDGEVVGIAAMRVGEVVESLRRVAVLSAQPAKSSQHPGVGRHDAQQLDEPLGRLVAVPDQLAQVRQLVQHLYGRRTKHTSGALQAPPPALLPVTTRLVSTPAVV